MDATNISVQQHSLHCTQCNPHWFRCGMICFAMMLGNSFRPCRNSAWEYLRQFARELFCEAISGVIIRDCSRALHTCRHNLLMVLRATRISSVTMVSEPHGNTPSFNRLNNKPNALFHCCKDISL